VLEEHDKSLAEDYDFAIPHQTSMRAIRIGDRKWSGFFKSKVPETLVSVDNFGNTASTSHFLVLCKHLEDQRLGKGSRVLFLALASGITIGFLSATVGELGHGDNHSRSLVQHGS
jgi:3-oxoacyl-[acyl-carrier-protein] synthase-3